jgi:hypothetical protein
MAVLAPLYETGVWRVIAPSLMLLFVVVLVLFMRRAHWTWKFMQTVAFMEIAINAFFFPTQEFHGTYTGLAQVLIATVMASSCVILWSLVRSEATRVWFGNRDA